jgi:phage terminase large subunit-like protein
MVKATATDCPPLYATPRNPSRPTLGGDVATIAEQLGTPFMPWQRLVADVAMEVDPATGLLAYREVDLTTPRQSGKTTLVS